MTNAPKRLTHDPLNSATLARPGRRFPHSRRSLLHPQPRSHPTDRSRHLAARGHRPGGAAGHLLVRGAVPGVPPPRGDGDDGVRRTPSGRVPLHRSAAGRAAVGTGAREQRPLGRDPAARRAPAGRCRPNRRSTSSSSASIESSATARPSASAGPSTWRRRYGPRCCWRANSTARRCRLITGSRSAPSCRAGSAPAA